MRIGIFGGSFNPPHIGHLTAARRAAEQLRLDKLLVIPSGVSPHKSVPSGTPPGGHRLEMARLAFRNIPNADVSGMEIRRAGESYTSVTVRELEREYPGAEFFLITGTDMYLTLTQWRDADYLLNRVTLAVYVRDADDAGRLGGAAATLKQRGAETVLIRGGVVPVSSSELRRILPERGGAMYIDDSVYWYIIENGLYGAKPSFDSLRRRAYGMLDDSRVRHVAGCEEAAVNLARRWGADEDGAREAAILHDITKRCGLAEQLALCAEYGIVPDEIEIESDKLLHAKTAAAMAKCKFNVNNAVSDAILWHTTGRADMTLLEKIIYMADYIEPTRVLDGVDAMRRLAYEDLDLALVAGMDMALGDLAERNKTPHKNTLAARDFLVERVSE